MSLAVQRQQGDLIRGVPVLEQIGNDMLDHGQSSRLRRRVVRVPSRHIAVEGTASANRSRRQAERVDRVDDVARTAEVVLDAGLGMPLASTL